MKPTKKKSIFLKVFWVISAVLLAGGLYFIYVYVPSKVALGILAKTSVHKSLTRTPMESGLAYQDVTFPTKDGITLSGWWIPALGKKKAFGTVLLSHGFTKNREQVLDRAEFLVKSGYQVLLFDHRGHGLSGNSPISGGVLESRDYPAAVQFLKGKGRLQRPVVFFGFSLGGISALRAAVTTPEAEAVIADSPLANLKGYVSRRTMGGRFARLPGFLGRCLSDYDQLTGLSLKETDLDLIPVAQKLHSLPALYITGEGDDLAKSDEVRELFEKTDSHERRLVYIPEAGHEETYSKFPIIYQKAVIGFLTDLRKGFPKPKEE